MRARPATLVDLPGIHAVSEAYGDLARWPDRPDYLDHELEHGRLAVSEDDDGTISGFGAALDRGGLTYLADLFILPDRLGGGRGGAIMGVLFPDDRPRFTFASSDPRARPLYERHGMRGTGRRLLYLGADGKAAARLPDPGGRLREVTAADVVEADARAGGRERPQDLSFLGLTGSFFTTERAYGYLRIVRDEALLNPSGGDDPDALAAVTIALARLAAATAAVVRIAAMEDHPALAALLAGGFAIEDFDTYMTSAPDRPLRGDTYGPSPVIG